MGLHYKFVCCSILVFLAALFRPTFNSENYDLFLIEDIYEPIGTTGVRSTGIGSFFPLFLPLLVMMMPMRMPDGTMMTMIQMLMMRMNLTTTTTTTSTTTTTITTVKSTTPCVTPGCSSNFEKLSDQRVSPNCFRAVSGRGQLGFDSAQADCRKTPSANLWCPEQENVAEAVRSKFSIGEETMIWTGCKAGTNNQYTCQGSNRACDPVNPPFGTGCGEVCSENCVEIEKESTTPPRWKWTTSQCGINKVYVCEIPITPCPS